MVAGQAVIRQDHSGHNIRVRTKTSLVTDLDEAVRLLMESDIDPSNVTAQTKYRLRARVRRIDASLKETSYFEAIKRPPSAIAGVQGPTFTESDRKKDFFRESLVHGWATCQLDEALAYALNSERSRDRLAFVIAALSTRLTDAPLDAMARVAELPDATLRDPVRQEVYWAWLVSDPMSAMSWAEDWPDERPRKSYLKMGGAEISKTDPALALRAVAGIQAGDERRNALGGIASTWSLQDPQALAANLLNDPHSNPADNEAMVSVLVYNWYQRDRQAALNWTAGLPEGGTRHEAERFLTQVMKVAWPANTNSRSND